MSIQLPSTSQVTCASLTVLDGKIDMPLRGTWIATLTLDADAPPTGLVDIVFNHEDANDFDVFEGTVLYASRWQGRSKVTIVGGKGGLSVPELEPKNYIGLPLAVPLSILLDDLVAETAYEVKDREEYADGVIEALDGFSLGRWQRSRAGAGRGLSILADTFGLGWRVQANGLVWIGVETWPVVYVPPFDISDDGVSRVLMVAPGRATWVPGTILFGKRINRIVYLIGENAVRAELHYGVGNAAKSDANDARNFVRTQLPELPYTKNYFATVLLQEPGGELTVRCDDADIGELASVPFYVGIPGAKVIIEPGSRVVIHFASSSPDNYYATGLDIKDDSTASVARVGDNVECPWLLLSPGTQILSAVPPKTPLAIPFWGTISTGYDNIKLPPAAATPPPSADDDS
jgi:hypothetical protein